MLLVLPCRFVQSQDKRLLRLKPFSHSAAVWFRNPYAHVILVRTPVQLNLGMSCPLHVQP